MGWQDFPWLRSADNASGITFYVEATEHTCRRWLRHHRMAWQSLSQVVFKPGQQWYGQVYLWQDQTIQTNLSAIWEPGHKEAWFLISDLPAGKSRVHEYALRMRVEATLEA